MDGQPENFDALPIPDRLSHKVWKARLSAYTQIVADAEKTVDEDDALFREHWVGGSSIREWVRDANAVAQEKGVEAACKVVEFGGKGFARSRSDVVPSVVEKCLGSTRAGTRTKAIELCLLYVEVEEDKGEGVVADVVPGLDAKQPKVVAGSVSVLKEIVRCFGPKTVSLPPILRTLPKIFAHADKTVRSQGQLLCLALHSYLGPALTPHLSELKPVQQKELSEAFEAADRGEKGDEFGFGRVKPSRFTVGQKREMARKEAEGQLNGGGGEEGEAGGADDGGEEAADEDAAPPDPFDFASPTAILSSLPADFYNNLSSSKWKDRKELALEPLLALLSASPRYESDNYSDLAGALAGRMGDANVLCVVLAAQCLEKLARGLRGEFARYKQVVTPPVLARTKEKKQNVLDALGGALDAVFASTSIGDFTEDILTFAKDKNPSVKASTLSFYTRCLSSTPTPPPKADLPPLIEAFKKTLEDSDAAVRGAAADVLGTLSKVVGERAFNALVGEMDPLRMGKVKEAEEKAVVKCKGGVAAGGGGAAKLAARAPPAAAAAPKPKPPAARAPPRPAAEKENAPPSRASPALNDDDGFAPLSAPSGPPKRGPPARLAGAKKPPAAAAPASAPAAKKPPPSSSSARAPAPSASSAPSAPLRPKYTQESAESAVENGESIPADIVALLGDSNWKQRLEGMEKLEGWCKLEGRQSEAEVVVKWLVGKKPGPKESNFQVSAKLFALLSQLAADSPSWTKACSAAAIPLLCDKLGDIKLKKPAGEALTAFAEKSSAGFVLGQAYDPMSKQKAVKTLAESFLFVDQLLRDFGLAGGLAVRDLIEFLKVGLKHSNAQVRTNATKTLVTLRLFVGPDVTSFLSDLTPQLLSTIDSEFDKVASEAPPEPTRVGADTAAPPAPAAASSSGGAAAGGKGGRGGAPEVDPLDELFPRVDFDRLVSGAQAQACGDANWKVRKEALEGIRDLLEANKRIKPTAMPDLANPLKQRITDSNKIIQILALDIVARLAAAMGRPFGEKLSRVFASAVTTTLADQKANIRAAGVTTLTAMADSSGLDGLVGAFDKPLEGNNSVQRKELLGWLEERFKADEEASVGLDLAPLAPGLLSCLEDRNTDVRKSATAILPTLVGRAGYGTVMDAVAKLKPASKSTVLPLVEAARSAAPTSAPSAPAPAAAAPPARAPAARPAPAAAKPAPSAPSSAAPSLSASAASSRPASGLSRPAAKPLRTAATAALEEPAAPSALPSRLAAPRSRPSIGGLRAAASASRTPAPPSSAPSSPSLGAKEAPFRSADPNPKLLRHKKETGSMRWVVDGTPRSDQVDWLAQQMAPQVSAALHGQLFSTDHSAERDFLAGLTVIDEVAKDPLSAEATYDVAEEEMRERLIANLDLIFKYITLRIGMTSTTITVKCLDVVEHLIPILSQASYKTSDYEATPLLLSLINKVGDSKEVIRQRVRGIFKAICSVYPFSKVFSTILEHGLDNKNARARSECVEELGQLYARHGVNVHPISQALPKIAAFIGKPDATTRTAALHAIGAVYTLVGTDATWKAVGQLPPKDRSMLEERLKRTATGAASPAPAVRMASAATPVARPGTPSGLRPPSNVAAPSSPSPAAGSNGFGQPRALPRPGGVPSRLQRPQSVALGGHQDANGAAAAPAPRAGLSAPGFASKLAPPSSRVPSASSAIPAPMFTEDDLMAETASDLPSLIDALETDDFTTSADVLKLITREITKNSEDVHLFADQLIDALTSRMELGFTNLGSDTPPAQLRLCKHLMQTLSAFFDKRALSQQVSRLPLTALLADLTGRLLDTADNPASEPIQSLSKVLNMVLIRIFHNSDQNVCFGALLTVLQDATIDLRELRGDDLTDRAKYAELVMKCLWKVSKTVKESLESRQLTAPRLLADINSFLVAIPPAEWRRRATDNVPLVDLPLRTVKTILQQIVSIFKEAVFDELNEIEGPENSFVYQYLYRLVAQPGSDSKANEMAAPSLVRQTSASSLGSAKTRTSTSPPRSSILSRNGSNGSGASTASAPPPVVPPVSSPGGSDITINQRLKEIFDLIGDPNNSRAGIAELYEFQKEHPEAAKKVETWMSGTGSYFQTYLKRALANLKAADPDAKEEPPLSPSLDTFGRPSSRSSRPSSVAPDTPTRASRMSIGSAAGGGGSSSTPQQSAKLQELQSMFGFAQKE
ncbi:hypothetical protein JCM6882_003246 [Rhodosporidiobolus microsporus]